MMAAVQRTGMEYGQTSGVIEKNFLKQEEVQGISHTINNEEFEAPSGADILEDFIMALSPFFEGDEQ